MTHGKFFRSGPGVGGRESKVEVLKVEVLRVIGEVGAVVVDPGKCLSP